ncbi:MAG: hypothetical protein JWM06_2900, partial [Actinomycetia bacterium]|nr:hypothetical protein [Actinomycetes bacterium]
FRPSHPPIEGLGRYVRMHTRACENCDARARYPRLMRDSAVVPVGAEQWLDEA